MAHLALNSDRNFSYFLAAHPQLNQSLTLKKARCQLGAKSSEARFILKKPFFYKDFETRAFSCKFIISCLRFPLITSVTTIPIQLRDPAARLQMEEAGVYLDPSNVVNVSCFI